MRVCGLASLDWPVTRAPFPPLLHSGGSNDPPPPHPPTARAHPFSGLERNRRTCSALPPPGLDGFEPTTSSRVPLTTQLLEPLGWSRVSQRQLPCHRHVAERRRLGVTDRRLAVNRRRLVGHRQRSAGDGGQPCCAFQETNG